MTVCRYFQQGRCAYGNACKFEHPIGQAGFSQNSSFGNQPGNEFEGFTVSPDTIQTDLTKERPLWKLSSYAPGKNPPVQLIDGKDVSPEELRFRAWELNATGMGVQFHTEAAQLESAIDTQVNNILSNISGAVAFMTEAGKTKEHYRYGQPPGSTTSSLAKPGAPTSAFGTMSTTSAFGAPSATSAFGAPPSTPAFGAPSTTSAFGAPTTATTNAFSAPTSAFGAPSAFGQSTSAFGTPSAFAPKPTTTPAFGQPSLGLSGPTSGFGQSSTAPTFGKPAFGQPAFGQPAFGQTTFGSSTTAPAFGQPAFGQTAFSSTPTTSAFGATQSQTQTSAPAFGAPTFGVSAFGQPKQSAQTSSPFGAGAQSAFSKPDAPSVFAPVNTFASPQQPQTANTFSQPKSGTFGSTGASGPFGQPGIALNNQVPVSQSPQNAFGATVFGQAQQPANTGANAFSAFGNLLSSKPAEQATVPSGGVGGGKWDDPPIKYTSEEIAAFQAPEFVLGKIPLVPPSQEMCR